MIFLRLAIIPLGIVFMAVLFVALAFLRLDGGLLNPDYYPSLLEKTDVYRFVTVDVLSSALDETRRLEPEEFGGDFHQNPLAASGLHHPTDHRRRGPGPLSPGPRTTGRPRRPGDRGLRRGAEQRGRADRRRRRTRERRGGRARTADARLRRLRRPPRAGGLPTDPRFGAGSPGRCRRPVRVDALPLRYR